MKKNRVDCINCVEFIPAVFKNEFMIMSGIKTNAKCKLGKRVMFRMPKTVYDESGWFRYCEEFNDKINDNIQQNNPA